jgi:MSHA pilin protein MshD
MSRVAVAVRQAGFSPAVSQAGLTLVELVMAIVVAGVVLGGMLSAWTHSVKHSADPLVMRQSLVLARGLLSEVMARPVLDPATGTACPPGPAERGAFDNLCDYADWQTDVIADVDGRVYEGFAGYRQSVSVTPQAWGDLQPGEAWRVEVRVENPLGQPVVLEGWKTCRGAADACKP